MSMNEAEVIITRLKQIFSITSDSALCKVLKVSPQTLSSWKLRNKIPYANCVEIGYQRKISLDWLLTGRGDMYLSDAQSEAECTHCEFHTEMTIQEHKWLEVFRSLSPETQKNIIYDAEKAQRICELEQEVRELTGLRKMVEKLKNAG